MFTRFNPRKLIDIETMPPGALPTYDRMPECRNCGFSPIFADGVLLEKHLEDNIECFQFHLHEI